ncbi:MAG: acetolactate synthase large subunit, partial [Desulfovibrionaceae bacterium]|nr:acetolactate synthase large subunit [Desulfovibrionaceae bacterium]
DITEQPDFLKLADAYGMEGYRIVRIEDLKPTLKTALESPGTALIEVRVDENEIVYPMVPSGAALDEMILS